MGVKVEGVKFNITRISVLLVGAFAMVLGGFVQAEPASALAAIGGGTKCTTAGAISGLAGTHKLCASIYQGKSLNAHPYGRLYIPTNRTDESKLELEVRYCNTSAYGTSCSSLAGTNPVQKYNITYVYNNNNCSGLSYSIIRGGTLTNSDNSCQTTSIVGGQSTVAGRWYLAQVRLILNGTVVKTINSPAQMAGN